MTHTRVPISRAAGATADAFRGHLAIVGPHQKLAAREEHELSDSDAGIVSGRRRRGLLGASDADRQESA
jgi:hypothetical protein